MGLGKINHVFVRRCVGNYFSIGTGGAEGGERGEGRLAVVVRGSQGGSRTRCRCLVHYDTITGREAKDVTR